MTPRDSEKFRVIQTWNRTYHLPIASYREENSWTLGPNPSVTNLRWRWLGETTKNSECSYITRNWKLNLRPTTVGKVTRSIIATVVIVLATSQVIWKNKVQAAYLKVYIPGTSDLSCNTGVSTPELIILFLSFSGPLTSSHLYWTILSSSELSTKNKENNSPFGSAKCFTSFVVFKTSQHFLVQSGCSSVWYTISRALHRLHIFPLRSDWPIRMSMNVVIGRSTLLCNSFSSSRQLATLRLRIRIWITKITYSDTYLIHPEQLHL